MTFAEKLVRLRKSSDFSQEDLADKLGVSRQTVYKWETGNALPDALNLKQISALVTVSMDGLKNDEAVIETRTLTNAEQTSAVAEEKKPYGQVKITDQVLENVDVESDNLPKTGKVKNTLITRKILYVVMAIICIVAFALAILCLLEQYIVGMIVSLVFTFLPILAAWLIYRFFGLKTISSRSYFVDKAKKVEEVMDSKNYWYVRLQFDMLAYFFYDKSTDSFGYYFLDGEQFVCPIRNYISLTCDGQGGGIVQTGTNLSGGVIAGSVNGVSVSSTPVYGNKLDTDYYFSLHYYDTDGEIREYTFKLVCFREYISYDPRCSAETLDYYAEMVAKSTREAFTKILGKLEGEKNRIA